MLIAVKGNTQLKIDDADRDTYLKLGYDIAEQSGNTLEVVENSSSKKVSWKEYETLVRENEDLRKQIAASGSGTPEALEGMKTQLDDANKEIKSLKKQLAAAATPDDK
ncbi:hypothetical protein P5G61_02265 [Paenibacillus sp. F6_3S_P_1C]|uniref:Uncharacterized protein n=1 Tax=Paenibacillus vandeheii TaxID=3035917 RepID=A0ABT8J4W4_9BACL|nr:hypothetical protein [Paenibacillus vandeheii]MDN4600037.1 hypothetical protein [Paenibacillus vandeheii]